MTDTSRIQLNTLYDLEERVVHITTEWVAVRDGELEHTIADAEHDNVERITSDHPAVLEYIETMEAIRQRVSEPLHVGKGEERS